MNITFQNLRRPSSIDQLTKSQQEQLAFAGKLYDGVDLPAAERLKEERAQDDDEEGVSFFGMLELWDVFEDGVHRYDAFLYMADSGILFEKDKTEYAIERIQTYFGGGNGNRTDDDDFADALQEAYREAKNKPAAQHKSKATGAWAAYESALQQAEKLAPSNKATAKVPPTKKPAAKKAIKKVATKKSTTKTTSKNPMTQKATPKKPGATKKNTKP
jgi:hypothetical protein